MKKKFLLILSALALFIAAFCAFPAVSYAAGTVVVEDGAELLTAEEEAALENVMQPCTEFGNIAFCSVSENQYTAEYYAGRFYENTFGLTDGAVFLIDMDNRKIYIYCQDAFSGTITSSRAETITDNVYKYASRGEYYECAAEAFREISTLMEGGRIAQPMKYTSNALLALIIALLVNFMIIRSASRLKAPKQKEVIAGANVFFEGSKGTAVYTHQTKRYDPITTSSGGGSGGGGGGFSGGGGGGGGGGGHSSSGGGHSF